jgi:hypothetical protein
VLRTLLALLFVSVASFSLAAQESAPELLLTPRRLHRLKLDSQRQTQRWTALEDRVRNVPDSPERGFELALYSAVKGDDSFCHEAARWALGHRTEYRQSALVANWCEAAIDGDERMAILASRVPENSAKPFTAARDKLFMQVARGEASRNSIRAQWAQLLPLIQRDPRVCLPEFYALFEFLDVADKSFRVDLRQDDGHLFANMPSVFLLSLSTGELEKPDWQTRIAGLMMVSVDPNLQGSSFVQGWAMEDPKTTHQGTGVAYEFLWANPYLPGLGFYNMQPWVYDAPSGLLLARSSWDAGACRVSWFHKTSAFEGCLPDERTTSANFGKLTLLPIAQLCATVPRQGSRTFILSNLKPGATVQWEEQKKKRSGTADASGLFLVSAEITGKVCEAKSN